MRTALAIVGVVLVLVGGLWVLQGLGYVGGSFMSGARQWFWIGLGVAAVGLVLAVLGVKGRRG
ncbi:hypothetical protein ACIBHX_25990 [Nonomuraea sp. NPDC050536]|uniref:hypothetical protein n=1 Tax=Nonomuraea sp. NPDC050536 TaxID=3364366 RepID=UPI0037C59EEF